MFSLQNSKNRLIEYFSSRFDVDDNFWDDFKVHEKGNSLWITSSNIELLENFVASGIRALRIMNHGFKPTTYILQFLNHEINKNVVNLSHEELKVLIFDREVIKTDLPRGYVALRYEEEVIGCGLRDSKGLRSQIPKGLARELEEIL